MSDRMKSIVSGTDEDLQLIRNVRDLVQASSDRETVRRMSIFCKVLLEHQKTGGELLLGRKGQPERLLWIV